MTDPPPLGDPAMAAFRRARRGALASAQVPLAALIAVEVAASLNLALFAYAGVEPPRETGIVWLLLSACAWSWWIAADRRIRPTVRGRTFDALTFVAWPVMLPWYLVRSRGRRSRSAQRVLWTLAVLPLLLPLLIAWSMRL